MQPHRGSTDPSLRDVPDDALFTRAAGNEPAAVDAFVARFADRLCSYVVRIVRDGAWADDLVQETLVRVLHDAHRYDARWPVQVWLFRVARNLALDLLRREGSHSRRLDELRAPGAATLAPAAVTTAEHREFQNALEQALQQVPESFRTVFLLRDGEGLSYEEIAAVLGISVKTVSSRLHRARMQLRTLLQEHLPR